MSLFSSLNFEFTIVHYTLSITVCFCTLPTEQASPVRQILFRGAMAPDALACKARPSSDQCGTSLSVSLSLSLSTGNCVSLHWIAVIVFLELSLHTTPNTTPSTPTWQLLSGSKSMVRDSFCTCLTLLVSGQLRKSLFAVVCFGQVQVKTLLGRHTQFCFFRFLMHLSCVVWLVERRVPWRES